MAKHRCMSEPGVYGCCQLCQCSCHDSAPDNYTVRCQFCGKESDATDWKRNKCPHCKREYDAMLAQEMDD